MTCQDNSALPRSVQAARDVGARHYFTGKPCPRGHYAPRFTCSQTCSECAAINARIKRGGDVTGQIDRRRTVPVECKVDGCERQAKKLGMCPMHWKRRRRLGSATAPLRRLKPGEKARNHCGKPNCPGGLLMAQMKYRAKLGVRWLEMARERATRSKAADPEGYRLKQIERWQRRKRAIKQATVGWSDMKAIARFYAARPEGHHVDHVIPLQGQFVCGLHVLSNLQYLTGPENFKKGNSFNGIRSKRSSRKKIEQHLQR